MQWAEHATDFSEMAAAGGAHGRILMQRAAYMGMLNREPCVFSAIGLLCSTLSPQHLEKRRSMIFLNI